MPKCSRCIKDIRVSDSFVELLDSTEWDCIYLDYELGALNCDFTFESHEWRLLNSDFLPPEPEILLLNRAKAKAVLGILLDIMNSQEFS